MSIVYTGLFSSSGIIVFHSEDSRINNIIEALASTLDYIVDQQRSFGVHARTFGYTIQARVENETAYVSACTSDLSHSIAFKFLKELAIEYSLKDVTNARGKDDFQNLIARSMRTAPENPLYNPLGIVNKQTEDLTDIMTDNIRRVTQRGDDLSRIQDTSERLFSQSSLFNRTANKLKCAMIHENIKYTVLLVLILLLIISLISIALYVMIEY